MNLYYEFLDHKTWTRTYPIEQFINEDGMEDLAMYMLEEAIKSARSIGVSPSNDMHVDMTAALTRNDSVYTELCRSYRDSPSAQEMERAYREAQENIRRIMRDKNK